MSANQTSKPFSERDPDQTLRGSFNDVDKSLTTSGWLTSQIGNKITQTISTTTLVGDTSTFSYYDKQITLLYSIKLIFTDATQSILLSAERIA